MAHDSMHTKLLEKCETWDLKKKCTHRRAERDAERHIARPKTKQAYRDTRTHADTNRHYVEVRLRCHVFSSPTNHSCRPSTLFASSQTFLIHFLSRLYRSRVLLPRVQPRISSEPEVPQRTHNTKKAVPAVPSGTHFQNNGDSSQNSRRPKK